MEKLLVLCAGRRVGLLQNLKTAMEQIGGQVIAQDIDKHAPALYYAHHRWIPTDDSIRSIYEYCQADDITGILALIDPMIERIAGYEELFLEAGIKLFQPKKTVIEICNDKSRMNEIQGLNVPPTCVIKPRYGSASRDQERVIQPMLPGPEYNAAVYFDYYTGQMVEVFMQKKIWMRAGETERGQSVWDDRILEQLFLLEQHGGFRGAVDIDLMESDGKMYVIDINPRFGGGYQMAAACGVNIARAMALNMIGKKHKRNSEKYKTGITVMKYDTVHILED